MPPAAWGMRGQTPDVDLMQTRLLFATLALGLLGLATSPSAAGQEFEQNLLQCGEFDANHDGGAGSDTWTYCATAQCGCYCPYVGAGVVVEAAGEEHGALVVASCQSGFAVMDGDADGPAGGSPVTVFPIIGGGGLDNIRMD
jgi:hypothetical protein